MNGGNQSHQMATRTDFSNSPQVPEYHEAQELRTPPSKNLGLPVVGCKCLLDRNKQRQSLISKRLHGHAEQGIVLHKQLCTFLPLLAILWKSAFRCLYLSFSPLLLASLLFTAICKASSDSHFVFLHFFSWGWS